MYSTQLLTSVTLRHTNKLTNDVCVSSNTAGKSEINSTTRLDNCSSNRNDLLSIGVCIARLAFNSPLGIRGLENAKTRDEPFCASTVVAISKAERSH